MQYPALREPLVLHSNKTKNIAQCATKRKCRCNHHQDMCRRYPSAIKISVLCRPVFTYVRRDLTDSVFKPENIKQSQRETTNKPDTGKQAGFTHDAICDREVCNSKVLVLALILCTGQGTPPISQTSPRPNPHSSSTTSPHSPRSSHTVSYPSSPHNPAYTFHHPPQSPDPNKPPPSSPPPGPAP